MKTITPAALKTMEGLFESLVVQIDSTTPNPSERIELYKEHMQDLMTEIVILCMGYMITHKLHPKSEVITPDTDEAACNYVKQQYYRKVA